MEGIGVPNGGTALVDRDMEPRLGDVVWCDCVVGGAIGGMLKQLVRTGKSPVVRTRYKDGKRDFMFYTPQIFGVVLEIRDREGVPVWKRPERSDYEMIKDSCWIQEDEGSKWDAHCRECGCKVRYNGIDGEWNRCPNCGAATTIDKKGADIGRDR